MATNLSTPRRWRVGAMYANTAILAGGKCIALCDDEIVSAETAEANTALIVRAVNCHDQLVAALRELLHDAFEDAHPDSVARARAALAACGEE